MHPHIIVFGNEKGGTGKSTLAMHLSVYLLKAGFKVSTIDLDAHQGTFTRYFENRKNSKYDLEMPFHQEVLLSEKENKQDAEKDEYDRFLVALSKAQKSHFIIVDTPGTNHNLSRIAHACADTLITPINDSFVDLDMLVRLDSNDLSIIKPSSFCPNCKHQIKWYENIPVFSYIFLKGRCSQCKSKIGLSSFIYELLGGIIFVLAFLAYGFSFETIFIILITAILYLIAGYDFKTKTILDIF